LVVAERDTRTLSPRAQEELRRRAVRAVVVEGRSQGEAARLFAVSRQTVNGWVKAHRQGGARALASRKRGRRPGEQQALRPWQQAQIARAIRDKHPDQLKLPFFLWTREAVRELIERRFRIRLSLVAVGNYLRRWGFTAQKPIRRAFEQDPERVRRWLEDEYPAIAQAARRQRAQILWADEMGLRSDHAAGRSFGLRGRTPVVPGTGRRFSASVLSAISNRGRLNFTVFTGRFNATLFIDFLKRLIRQLGRKLFLIVDGHPVHRARTVKDWLARHKDEIALFYLPPYSPELNPDELLNQDVKTNALGRRRPTNQAELVADTRSYLRRRQRRPALVSRYFSEPHVCYAAA
jgi:transposase